MHIICLCLSLALYSYGSRACTSIGSRPSVSYGSWGCVSSGVGNTKRISWAHLAVEPLPTVCENAHFSDTHRHLVLSVSLISALLVSAWRFCLHFLTINVVEHLFIGWLFEHLLYTASSCPFFYLITWHFHMLGRISSWNSCWLLP